MGRARLAGNAEMGGKRRRNDGAILKDPKMTFYVRQIFLAPASYIELEDI